MNCFDKLINSKFLRQLGTEIDVAKSTVTNLIKNCPEPGSLPLSRDGKVRKYNSYMRLCGFRSEFDIFDPNDYDTLYYMNEGGILLIAAQTKQIVDIAILQSLTTAGNIPFHRTKHIVHGKFFYFAMYDLLFKIPATNNN